MEEEDDDDEGSPLRSAQVNLKTETNPAGECPSHTRVPLPPLP